MLWAMLGYMGTKTLVDKMDSNVKKYKMDYGIYFDNKGKLRYKGKEVIRTIENGDVVYKDVKNSKICVNKTLIDAQKNEKIAKEKGKKYFLRQPDLGFAGNKLGNGSISGERYCKVGNNYSTCYVKRKVQYKENGLIYSGEYYMDMRYKFYAPTEETNEADIKKYGNNSYHIQQKILQELNKKMKIDFWKSNRCETVYVGNNNDNFEYKDACKKISAWK